MFEKRNFSIHIRLALVVALIIGAYGVIPVSANAGNNAAESVNSNSDNSVKLGSKTSNLIIGKIRNAGNEEENIPLSVSSEDNLSRIHISTPLIPVGMGQGESKLIPYHIVDSEITAGKITSRTFQFFTQYDMPLSEPFGPFPTDIGINPAGTSDWNELVYLPATVADRARANKDYALVLKTNFDGVSQAGAKFSADASLLILLPPADFSKASPANGAVVSSGSQSLQWDSSVGAIDYEYCFDIIDNDSCDTSWTGTYWLGTYDTNVALQNLSPNTTFYWQVRANNTAGTMYSNNGVWWEFTTASNTPTSTFTPSPSFTPTPTATKTQTVSPTWTPTPTATASSGFPSSTVLDTFNRANGGVGANWSGSTSGYSIASNRLDVGNGAPLLWNATSFGTDQEAFVTLTNIDPAGFYQDLILKSQSATSWESGAIDVSYDAARKRVIVWTFSNAQGWVQRGADIPVTFVNGDQFGVRARSNGTVEVYRNGVLIATRDVSGWTYSANGGYIGVWYQSAANAILDDFGGGSLSSVQTATLTIPTISTLTSAPSSTATNIPTSTQTLVPSFTPSITSTPTRTPTLSVTSTSTPTPSMFIQVLQPNGGEVLTVGSTYRITWNSSPNIDKVSIGYKSCDSCLDWIAFSAPNVGYYDWNVSVGNTINTQFKISITGYDTGVGSVTDLSDANFTVLQPTPTPTFTRTPTATSLPSLTPTVTTSSGFPSSGVLDTFNRANGGVGASWSGSTSGYSIASNRLDVGNGAPMLWNATSFGANQEAFVTLTNIDPSGFYQDLILKSQSATSWENGAIDVSYDAAGKRVIVWTFSNAQGWVRRGADIPVTFVNGDQFGVRARSNGTVEIYRNGVLIATRDVSGWTYSANGGYIGVWYQSAANAVLDDFGGGSLSSAQTATPTATPTVVPLYTISGNVGIAGAMLSYIEDGAPKNVIASSNGSYSFTVKSGWSGTVTPSKVGATFVPASRSYVDVNSNYTGSDYVANIRVNTTSDGGPGSLRQAISDALPGATIRFEPSLAGESINLGATLVIRKDLEIDGSDVTPRVEIDGGGTLRIFDIGRSGGTSTLDSLVLKNGNATSTSNGGAIFVNGGVIIIKNVAFIGNSAYDGGAIYSALYNVDLRILQSEFSSNTARNRGGAIFVQYGGLTIQNSRLNGNTSTSIGGAITTQQGGPYLIENNNFTANNSGSSGGAIGLMSRESLVVVRNNLFSTNTAALNGGALFDSLPYSLSGSLTIENNTFYNNSANNAGAILVSATVSLNNNTFSNNRATQTLTTTTAASVYLSRPLTATLINNIFANTAGGYECVLAGSGNYSVSGNNNLVEDGSGPCSTLPNAIVSDPMLGLLADNGGATLTMALLPGSPAIDAGDNASCSATDQRGVTRPQGNGCDIGAYEYDGPIVSTPTFTPSAMPPTSTFTPTKTVTPTRTPTSTATKTSTPTPTTTEVTVTASFTPIVLVTPPPFMFVQVLRPNGGEVLNVGSTYRIIWNSSSNIDKVFIGYKSCDSCLDWIATDLPNVGYYDWNVSVGNTTNTQFKISITGYDTGVGSVTDTSDADFTVLQPTPTPTFTRTPTATSIPSLTPTATTSSGFPSSTVLDTFNRANGGVGTSWSGSTSGYSIASNRLDVGNGAPMLWNATSFGTNQEAFVTLTNIDASGFYQDLILKSQSATSWESGAIDVSYDAARKRVIVWTFSNAQGWVQRGADIPVTFVNGDQFGVRARSNGTVEVYRNGVLIGTRDVSGWTYSANGGYIGVWYQSATNAVLDDFGGGSLSSVPTATPTFSLPD